MSLIPGLAHAADPAPAPGKAHGVALPDQDLSEVRPTKTFTSPAEAGTKSAAPAAGTSKAAGAPKAQTAADPTYRVGLTAVHTSAHGIELAAKLTAAADQSLQVTIDWGDNSWQESYGATGTGLERRQHAYSEVGTYLITVKAEDTAAGTSVTNTVSVTTMGSEFTPHTPTRLLDTRDGTGAPKGKVGPNGSARLKVAGVGKIPAGATTAVLNVTVTNATAAGHITAFASGAARPTTSNLNFEPGQTVPNLVVVPIGTDGYVDLYNSGLGTVDLIADVTGYFTQSAASGYTAITPERFVDTRIGLGTRKGQVEGFKGFGTAISGVRSVPAGATAVALNVTVTNPKDDGHLTVYPGGTKAPTASNLNFRGGQTVANSVIVPIGADGKISIRNGGWKGTDVIVDVVGFYSPNSQAAYVPFQPFRWLDTREWKWGPLPGRHYIPMRLSTKYPGTKAFIMNTTVTNTKGVGFLAVAPDPNSKEAYEGNYDSPPSAPGSSTLNFTPGKTVPNLVQASTGYHGIIDVFNESDANIDVVVDIFGDYEVD
ncbi:hypothetical protein OG898_34135 [Streptomyces sp. NBC_00193]|uniref:hypothetical protein n=1 Tax=Streptomyces sp. NBC_00193 TaxID=2975675 RepID=UPI002256452D|nr:hypothetical protein [Streptomyces sp. NBC_00193]MCX5301448.1 hypothetical protein [Streptomyces sp. NBC_00193]